MYRYGNKSFFDFDQGLKVLLRLNESDDFFYNIPLQGAQVAYKYILTIDEDVNLCKQIDKWT